MKLRTVVASTSVASRRAKAEPMQDADARAGAEGQIGIAVDAFAGGAEEAARIEFIRTVPCQMS